MKRFNIFSAAFIVALGVSFVSAQDTTNIANEPGSSENPVADLTARIMREFFPNAPLENLSPELPTQEHLRSRITAAAGNWSNLRSFQNLQSTGAEQLDSIVPQTNNKLDEIEQRMQQLTSRFPGLAERGLAAARSATSMAQSTTARSTASASTISSMTSGTLPLGPKAIAMSFANGMYSIEAMVDADGHLQKVRLNGTKAEVQEQIRKLDPTIREALGARLGL